MPHQPLLRLRFFRSLFALGFVANGAALFAYRPAVSFLVSCLTLAFICFSFRCANCGKSPYVLLRGRLRFGSAVPERVCSKCGFNSLSESVVLAPPNNRWRGP
jgi:hypothetical protein